MQYDHGQIQGEGNLCLKMSVDYLEKNRNHQNTSLFFMPVRPPLGISGSITGNTHETRTSEVEKAAIKPWMHGRHFGVYDSQTCEILSAVYLKYHQCLLTADVLSDQKHKNITRYEVLDSPKQWV